MIAVLFASSSSGPGWILLFGPLAGGGFYYGWWSYYRNTNKRHDFERETRITAKPITGQDTKVDSVHGTSRSRIQNSNESDHRERVQRIQ